MKSTVQRFPELGNRRTVSTSGGHAPQWSPDGRELFYANSPALMVVPVETEPDFEAGIRQTLF